MTEAKIIKKIEKRNSHKKETADSQKKQSSDLKVKSRFVRMTPDKIRLVAKALIGKKLDEALDILPLIKKSAKTPLILLLKNASYQAKDKNLNNLLIKTIFVDESTKLKRRRIIHRGRARPISKRFSHITVILSGKSVKNQLSRSKNGS